MSLVRIQAALPNMKGDKMISLLFGVAYGEVTWMAVEKGKNTIKQAKNFAWFIVGINFMMAMVAGSLPNLEISIVIAYYALVIFNLREAKNKSK